MNRRAFVASVVTGITTITAGCSSSNDEEFEAIADNIEEHFTNAERLVDSASRNIEREEWGQCGADLEGASDDISDAEREIDRGLRRAENEGHLDAADALDLISEYANLLENAVTGLQNFCDEMNNGNRVQAEAHLVTARENVNEYEDMERDIERALEDLE